RVAVEPDRSTPRATAAPGPASWNALAGVAGRVTRPEKFTVTLVTRDRWTAPSLTFTWATVASGGEDTTTVVAPNGLAVAQKPSAAMTWKRTASDAPGASRPGAGVNTRARMAAVAWAAVPVKVYGPLPLKPLPDSAPLAGVSRPTFTVSTCAGTSTSPMVT